MSVNYEKLVNACGYVRERAGCSPKVGIVLGSGLGGFAEETEIISSVDYSDIPDFPRSTVEGHKGRFIFGKVSGVEVVMMQGRVHYYEGYPMEDVVMPTRLMGMLGVETLLLTNAAGGIDRSFKAGDIMLITDHIAAFVPNPLIGRNDDRLGVRFPDMSEVYDITLREKALATASELGTELKQGVYAQLTGPSYETPAEIRMLETIGASAVGMSTACEAIAARHMGLKVCGLSLISNMAAGINSTPLSHEEVQQAADDAAERFTALVKGFIGKLG